MPRNRNDRPDPRMNGRRDYDEDDRRKKNGMNMKKIFGISFCIVLGIVVISGAVIYRLGHDMYSSINYVADEDVRTVETPSGGSYGRNAEHGGACGRGGQR